MDTDVFLDEVARRISAYIASVHEPQRVNPPASLATMRRTLDLQLPLEGQGIEAALDDLDTFIANSVKTHRAEFMNPLWGGLSLPAFAGEVIAAMTNNSMYTYELSPIATVIEQTILRRMSEMLASQTGLEPSPPVVQTGTCSVCSVHVNTSWSVQRKRVLMVVKP